jgi:hypothetical protein
MSARIIVGFLPYLSANGPPKIEPNAAPNVASDTIVLISINLRDSYLTSISSSEIPGQVSSKCNYAPAITPVSYLNKIK